MGMRPNAPTVSVLMITYNHQTFIEQAVRSVMMQKADFEFELVIGEDCSTDNTRSMLYSFKEKWPQQIRILAHDHNLGMYRNFCEVLRECRGEFLAILEGDDYWLDPLKLQKQVDALRQNPEWAICFHRARGITEGVKGYIEMPSTDFRPVSRVQDIIESNFIYTPTVMYRGAQRTLPDWLEEAAALDWPFHVLNAMRGDIGFLPDTMSAYRVHSNGVWSSKPLNVRVQQILNLFDVFDEHLDPKYRTAVRRGRNRVIQEVLGWLNEAYPRSICLDAGVDPSDCAVVAKRGGGWQRQRGVRLIKSLIAPVRWVRSYARDKKAA